MSARRYNRSAQVSACSVVSVPFELDVSVGHSACSVVTVPFELDVSVGQSQFDQRANIKFMCKLGKSASETLSALQQVYEWLLAVLYSENGPQVDTFRNHGGHQIECDGRTPEDYKRSLLPVLPTMAGSIEQVCVCARVLLWMWSVKRCRMSYHYSAIPPFRELFDCPS
jgi:hypothetical protein